MSQEFDRYDRELRETDLVRAGSIHDALFRIKRFQYPHHAIIENVLPGGRLGTSTLPCADLVKQISNPGPPDPRYGEVELSALPASRLPCGCHLRRPDLEAVLCDEHLLAANGAAE